MAFENKQGIAEITMQKSVYCYCPMGSDWYTADVEVTVANPKEIPDYLDVDAFFKSLNNSELIIEDVVFKVHEFVSSQVVAADEVIATATVKNAKHLPVRVTKR